MSTQGASRDGSATGGFVVLGVAALAIVCCGGLPLVLAALAGGIAVGALLGVGVGLAALAGLAVLLVALRRRGAACLTPEVEPGTARPGQPAERETV